MKILVKSVDNQIYPLIKEYYKLLLPNYNLFFTPIEDEFATLDSIEDYVCDQKEYLAIKEKMSPAEARLLEMHIKCGIQQIESQYQLIEKEKLISYEYSYFINEFHNIPEGTPFIRRKTCVATIYFVFDDTSWEKNQISFIEPEVVDKEMCSNMFDTFINSSLLADLGLSVVKGFLGKIGAEVFDQIFASDRNHFDGLYQELTKIIKTALVNERIDYINGEIGGIILYVKNTHNPRKSHGGVPKEKLYNELKPHYDKLNQVIGVLMSNSYNKPGFSIFMLCAYELILLAQELALVDPYCDSPTKSSYYQTIKKLALDFSQHAKAILPPLQEARKNYFSYSRYQEGHVCGRDVVVTYYYKWKDSYSNTSSVRYEKDSGNKKYDPEQDCKNNMEATKNYAANQLRDSLQYDSFIQSMEMLSENPLPYYKV